jgi:hypothetical protein
MPRPIIALPAQVVALLQPKFYRKDYEHRLNKVRSLIPGLKKFSFKHA